MTISDAKMVRLSRLANIRTSIQTTNILHAATFILQGALTTLSYYTCTPLFATLLSLFSFKKLFFSFCLMTGTFCTGFVRSERIFLRTQKRSTKNGPNFFLAMRPRRFSCKYLQKMRRKWQEHSLREFKNARTLSK